MKDNGLNLDDILKIQEDQRKRNLELYKNVLSSAETNIRMYADSGHTSCYYDIPAFVWGYGVVDINKTKEYILGILNKKGFIALADNVEFNRIYINWEMTEVLRKKMLDNKKNDETSVDYIKEKHNNELKEIFLKKKFSKLVN